MSVCLFVCLYPLNVKTAEPIGPNKECPELQKAASKSVSFV